MSSLPETFHLHYKAPSHTVKEIDFLINFTISTMVWFSTVATLALIWLAKWLWSRRQFYILSWKMPGPICVPLLGSAFALLRTDKLNYIDQVSARFDKQETPIRIWLGTKLFIYVDNIGDIETVLTSSECVNREDIYQYIQEALGCNGLFTLEGNAWRHHRRLVSPSFNYSVVISYLPSFNENCIKLLDALKEQVGKPIFDIRPIIVSSSLDLFMAATFGSNICDKKKELFKEYIAEGQSIISKRMFQPWYQVNFIWNMTKYPAKLEKFRLFARELINEVVADKLEKGSESLTFLERLLRVSDNNQEFTQEDVRAEATNALTAAADSAGWSIAFTLLMLAMHPEIQDQVFDELHRIFPDKNATVTRSDLEKLNLLERCILETLRLFPIVVLMARKCSKSFMLNGYEITPGMSLAVGVKQVHRKTKYWGPNAHLFNPDNFLPKNIAKRNHYCYIPFSGGQRNCIGEKYAIIVLKLMLANILLHYRMTTPLKFKNLRIRMDVNIFLINKHLMQVHLRE